MTLLIYLVLVTSTSNRNVTMLNKKICKKFLKYFVGFDLYWVAKSLVVRFSEITRYRLCTAFTKKSSLIFPRFPVIFSLTNLMKMYLFFHDLSLIIMYFSLILDQQNFKTKCKIKQTKTMIQQKNIFFN